MSWSRAAQCSLVAVFFSLAPACMWVFFAWNRFITMQTECTMHIQCNPILWLLWNMVFIAAGWNGTHSKRTRQRKKMKKAESVRHNECQPWVFNCISIWCLVMSTNHRSTSPKYNFFLARTPNTFQMRRMVLDMQHPIKFLMISN